MPLKDIRFFISASPHIVDDDVDRRYYGKGRKQYSDPVSLRRAKPPVRYQDRYMQSSRYEEDDHSDFTGSDNRYSLDSSTTTLTSDNDEDSLTETQTITVTVSDDHDASSSDVETVSTPRSSPAPSERPATGADCNESIHGSCCGTNVYLNGQDISSSSDVQSVTSSDDGSPTNSTYQSWSYIDDAIGSAADHDRISNDSLDYRRGNVHLDTSRSCSDRWVRPDHSAKRWLHSRDEYAECSPGEHNECSPCQDHYRRVSSSNHNVESDYGHLHRMISPELIRHDDSNHSQSAGLKHKSCRCSCSPQCCNRRAVCRRHGTTKSFSHASSMNKNMDHEGHEADYSGRARTMLRNTGEHVVLADRSTDHKTVYNLDGELFEEGSQRANELFTDTVSMEVLEWLDEVGILESTVFGYLKPTIDMVKHGEPLRDPRQT